MKRPTKIQRRAAIQKLIDRDPSIGPAEAKRIHAILSTSDRRGVRK
jgi:hypothetical protein